MTISTHKEAWQPLLQRFTDSNMNSATANGHRIFDGTQNEAQISPDTAHHYTASETEAQSSEIDPAFFQNNTQQLNKAPKEYQAFLPSEMAFNLPTGNSAKNAVSQTPPTPNPTTKLPPPPSPVKPPNPAAKFSPEEIKELTQRYGLRPGQRPEERIVSDFTDLIGWKHQQALYKIDAYAATIQETAQRYNLNPKVLGAILYDEIRHVKPGEGLAVAAGVATTFGLAQLGNAELVRHGFFDQDISRLIKAGVYDQDLQRLNKTRDAVTPAQLLHDVGPDKVVSRFPADVKQKGIDYLMDGKNNIDTLGRQLNRIRSMLNIPSSDRLTTDTFENTHNTAKVVVFHNGRLDYAARILEYMEIPELERALQGKYPE